MIISALAALLLPLSSIITGVEAIPKVTRSGKYLVDDAGDRFFIRGIAYQPQGVVVQSEDNPFGEPSTFFDPLANESACTRDLPHLQDLGVNTLRVYSVDSNLDHSACMQMFSDAGIYTIIDLALPLNGSIDRATPSWSTNIMDQYLRTIDEFAQYDNVLAVNVGNEVVTAEEATSAPFIKAATRDIKAYLESESLDLLIGYAAIDGSSSFRVGLAEFFSCDSEPVAIDLFGLNSYSWCGNSTYEDSYATIDTDYADYNVVAYFSEFGCISSPPRVWTEVAALFSAPMAERWSGGIAFSYFPAESAAGEFGMVTVSDDGSSVTTSDDFDRLQTQYEAISPPLTPTSGTDTYPTCSATLSSSLTLPGTPDRDACNCAFDALPCQFIPAVSDYSDIIGELIGTACTLLGEVDGSCAAISADGAEGVYGAYSGCDPIIKLSYAMSLYYNLNDDDAQSCSFAGNGTVNSDASGPASEVAETCTLDPESTSVPSAPSDGVPIPSSEDGGGAGAGGGSNPGAEGGSGSDDSNDNNPGNGAVGINGYSKILVAFGLMAVAASF